jgi:putative transposase
MVRNKRIYCDGYPYFITCNAKNRAPIFWGNAELLRDTFYNIQQRLSFELIAWVIIPDHLHLQLHPKEANISDIMHRIKLSFSRSYKKSHDLSREFIWQNGFWDHVIRNDEDYKRHVDYIHINPVKHGLVKRAFDWPYSSIHQSRNEYPPDWGVNVNFDGDFGE